MANPYHDAAGKFCSKGEMIADIKKLARGDDFNAYLKLQNEFDEIQKSLGVGEEDRIDDDFAIRPRVRVRTKEETQGSYAMVEDRVPGVFDSTYVPHLLSSKYLTPDQRASLIARASIFPLHDIIERDSSYSDTRKPLKEADYRSIMAREDHEEYAPLIAKNHNLSYEEKMSLLESSPRALGLMAIHDERIFADEDAMARLRADVAANGDENAGLSGLAYSPHAEDRATVMAHPRLRKGLPSPVRTLASNQHIPYDEAKALLEQEIAHGTDTATTVAHQLQWRFFNSDDFKKKFRFNDSSLTNEKKEAIRAELKTLDPSKDFIRHSNGISERSDSEEGDRHRWLLGKLHANDSDFTALKRKHAVMEMARASRRTEAWEREKHELAWAIRMAENYRFTAQIKSFFDAGLKKS